MRANVQLPDWLNPWMTDIVGFEKEGESGDKGDKEGTEEEEEEEESSETEGEPGKEDTSGLKSALEKERRDRKRLEKEAKVLRQFKEAQESKDDTEKDKATKDAEKAKQKAEKLAVKLRDTAVDNSIIKLAGKHKFRDLDDALRLIDRAAIEVEQDEDEPDEIDVDEKSVEKALKALATSKPHLVLADGEEDRSGSKFGGRKKDDTGTDEDALRNKYPALRRA